MKTQLRSFLDSEGKQRNIEEEHRKVAYPDICTPECEHVTCGYRTEENRGKPCFMKWAQYKTPPHPLPKVGSIEEQIESAVEKAFKPTHDRLKAIENATRTPVTRSLTPTFNGMTIPAGYPMLFEELQRRQNND